jgi:hypothetical protein
MRPNSTTLKALRGALLTMALLLAAPAQLATAAEGTSTPGTTVTAVNPAAAMSEGGMQILLNAHAEKSIAENPSCRPQDSTLDCWGTLVLRIPDAGGLSLSRFEVHRVAVGDVSCGDEHEDGCAGHETTMSSTMGVEQPVKAVVNGVAVLRDPGDTGEPRGSTVQVKMHLTDNGNALHADQIDVQINQFVDGHDKPEIYRSGPQMIQQVQIHAK